MKTFTLTLLVVSLFVITGSARAENAPANAAAAAPQAAGNAGGAKAAPPKKKQQGGSVIERLRTKLTKENGTPAQVAVLKPLDYTGVNLADRVGKIIIKGMERFTKAEIIDSDHRLEALNLEAFRIASIRSEGEVLLVSVLKPTGFEAFIYDRRNPYVVYTYAHTLPDPRVHRYSKKVIVRQTKQLLVRLLNNYVKDHFYELPRAPRTLAAFEGDLAPEKIPRTPLAQEVYFATNRELAANYYLSPSYGFFVSRGQTGKTFNSGTLSGQFGYRLNSKLYFEAALEMTSYNLVTLGVKKIVEHPSEVWRYLFGIGLTYGTARLTLNWDQTNDIGWTAIYVTPSAAVMFPVTSRAYFKAESRLYLGIGFKRFLFTFIPGLMVRF